MPTKPSRVLVTGGTGFLGAHVVDLLLERGITVVVTARSESKARELVERRARFKGLLEVVVTGDLSVVGAFDDLAKDVDVIIHCASPLPNHSSLSSNLPQSLIEPAISGTLSILQAARKNPTLKRLVLTSSIAAVIDVTKDPPPPGSGPNANAPYTADDWNSITYEEGVKADRPLVAYRAGKKFAELEAWWDVDPTSKHARQLGLDASYPGYGRPTKPPTASFDLTVICPPLIFGPWVHPLPSGLSSLNHPNSQITTILRGDYRSSHLPQTFSPHWVDVRDAALAHVEAALRLDSTSSNKRYVTCSPDKFNFHVVGEIIREEFPEWAEDVLPPRTGIPPFKNLSLDGSPVTVDLGVTYRSFRESIVDLIRQLREEILREAEGNKS